MIRASFVPPIRKMLVNTLLPHPREAGPAVEVKEGIEILSAGEETRIYPSIINTVFLTDNDELIALVEP